MTRRRIVTNILLTLERTLKIFSTASPNLHPHQNSHLHPHHRHHHYPQHHLHPCPKTFNLRDEILSINRFCSTRVLPTHEPFGALPTARTPFQAGVEPCCAGWHRGGQSLRVQLPWCRVCVLVAFVHMRTVSACSRNSRPLVALRSRTPLCISVPVFRIPRYVGVLPIATG